MIPGLTRHADRRTRNRGAQRPRERLEIVERILATVAAAFLAVAGLAAAQTAGGDHHSVVAMRTSVDLGPARAVTLADIAELTGPEAAKLGALEVLTARQTGAASRGVVTVDARRVRSVLDAAGVNWGRLSLRAVTTVVRVQTQEATPRDGQLKGTSPAQGAGDEPVLVDRSRAHTVRVAIADRLGELLGVEADSIKLGFKAQDSRVLDESTLGRVVDVQPGAGAGSGRIPLRVQVYEGDRLAVSATVTVEVLVRRGAVVTREAIDRREMIREETLLVEERWLNPAEGTPLSLEAVVGLNARARLAPGTVITSADVEAPVVVKRGEQVLVDCVSGGVVVQIKARAVRDGRDAEVVEFTPLGSKRTFGARMNGRGRAVMLIAGAGVTGG